MHHIGKHMASIDLVYNAVVMLKKKNGATSKDIFGWVKENLDKAITTRRVYAGIKAAVDRGILAKENGRVKRSTPAEGQSKVTVRQLVVVEKTRAPRKKADKKQPVRVKPLAGKPKRRKPAAPKAMKTKKNEVKQEQPACSVSPSLAPAATPSQPPPEV